jgi:hypothetical protein
LIFVLGASSALAQHVPIGPVSPIGLPPIGAPPPRPSMQQGPVRGGRIPPYFYPGYLGGYGLGGYGYAGYEQPATQNVVIVQQPPPVFVLPPAAPPEPVRVEISEYKPVPANRPSAPEAELKTFAIILKDGSTREAAAVSFQDGALLIVDPEGEHHRVELDRVDHEATRRINRQRGLQLQLPIR